VIPQDLSDRYRDWRWEAAHHFNPGQPTYRLCREGERRFLKLHPTGSSIADEAVRLRWAAEFLPVPRLIEYGSDGDYDWLLTEGQAGVDAAELARHPAADPRSLVIALGEGMRAFHEAVPVRECPFDFTIPTALDHVRRRLAAGLIDPVADFHPDYSGLTAEAAVQILVATTPAVEDEVVCHGDFCLPNVMIEEGKATGYLDLGSLGVSDRWADLAACARSCDFNLGPGYGELLFQAYGVAPDEDRLAWYRLLYDLR
jgi:kanamycin kinase